MDQALKHLIKLKDVYGLEPDLSRAKIAKKNKIKLLRVKLRISRQEEI